MKGGKPPVKVTATTAKKGGASNNSSKNLQDSDEGTAEHVSDEEEEASEKNSNRKSGSGSVTSKPAAKSKKVVVSLKPTGDLTKFDSLNSTVSSKLKSLKERTAVDPLRAFDSGMIEGIISSLSDMVVYRYGGLK